MVLPGFLQKLVAMEKPLPKPQGTEVLLKVLGAGVCHSDLHIWEGSYDLGEGRKLSMAGRTPFPLVMGHESCGEVVAMGPDARDVPMGGQYVVCAWMGCGSCAPCRAGDEHLCASSRYIGVHQDGGYSDHVLIPHPRYLIDLQGLDPVEAAPLACSGLTTYSALKKAGDLLKEERIVIVGAGGLGLMALDILRLMGGKGAVVVDIDPKKREAAIQAGAVAAIDPRGADPVAEIKAALQGPAHFALDLVGSGETAKLAFDLIDKSGKVVVVGLLGGAMTIPVPMLPMRAATLQGSLVGSAAELRELVSLVSQAPRLNIPVRRRPLAEADEALTDLREGRVIGRVVLVP